MDELARRIISEYQPADLHVGDIPERFAIPVPEGARVVGSVVRGAPDDPDSATAYLDVPGTTDQVRATFDRLFSERGFRPKAPGSFPGQGAGFQHSMTSPRMAHGATYCAGEDGPFYTLGIGAGDPAPVSVLWNGGQMGWNPCSSRAGHPVQGMEDIPSLSAPPGVMVQAGGGGGSPGAWYAQGLAFTDMPARTLVDHFAEQLAATQATQLAREDADSASWGRWKLPTKDLETIVAVIAARPAMRLLLRYTFSPGQQRRQNWMVQSSAARLR